METPPLNQKKRQKVEFYWKTKTISRVFYSSKLQRQSTLPRWCKMQYMLQDRWKSWVNSFVKANREKNSKIDCGQSKGKTCWWRCLFLFLASDKEHVGRYDDKGDAASIILRGHHLEECSWSPLAIDELSKSCRNGDTDEQHQELMSTLASKWTLINFFDIEASMWNYIMAQKMFKWTETYQ